MDDYLRDLQEVVATVKSHPEMAQSGSAATCGRMGHIPLRGMVNQKGLDMFAQMYQAGGQDIDLHAELAPEPGFKGQMNALVERVAQWYGQRQQRKVRHR